MRNISRRITPESKRAPGSSAGGSKIMLVTAMVAALLAGSMPAQDSGSSRFVLSSPEVTDGGILPVDFTGDGSGATLPLEWRGSPEGTASFAVVMHHVDPEGKTKWYWVIYNIPADVRSLPKNASGIGTVGNNSITGGTGYAPPHSKGPGAKTYIFTVYALSKPPHISVEPARGSREVLLDAIKESILASAELKVVYTRQDKVPPAPGTHGGT